MGPDPLLFGGGFGSGFVEFRVGMGFSYFDPSRGLGLGFGGATQVLPKG